MKFCRYLIELRKKNPDRKLVLFFDQLYVHTCPRVLAKMEELDIKFIKNAAYSPQFNGIEFIFSKVKRAYRETRLHEIVNQCQTQIRT